MIRRHYFAERTLSETGISDATWIDDYQAFRADTLTREKRCVILAKKRGPWLKPFHCYFHNTQYRYFSLDLAEGCWFDCVYCYLQTYLNHGALVLFVDVEDRLAAELREAGAGAWISTGLLTDSLLAESVFPLLPLISPLVPEGSMLELRTKSSDVACLENPSILRERVVVSWSLNPEQIAQRYEYGAAGTRERLSAARKAMSLGYKVGFHLDPVIHFEGWQELYAELIAELQEVPKEGIAFLSLGLFRFMPELGKALRKRFPYHEILTGEFFPDEDGKYHYFRGIRQEMHRAFREWLEPWSERMPVFWSMEPDGRIIFP